jgi:hypothetical protein
MKIVLLFFILNFTLTAFGQNIALDNKIFTANNSRYATAQENYLVRNLTVQYA